MKASEYLGFLKRFVRDRDTGRVRLSKGLYSFVRLGYLYFYQKRFVTSEDYGSEYDSSAETYTRWLERMGKYTDKIIKPAYLTKTNQPLSILDLACGSGYITRRLLDYFSKHDYSQFNIEGVDISDGMLKQAQSSIADCRVKFQQADAIDHLNSVKDGAYDAIFIGWAFPYFNHDALMAQINRTVKPGGFVFIISNIEGTLEDIEDIFVELVAENPAEVDKIPDVSFQLPAGKVGLKKTLRKNGFLPIELTEGNEEVMFENPRDLYVWLKDTGAIAGTGKIFKSFRRIEDKFVAKIKKRKKIGDQFTINHRFASGIFRKAGEDI